MYYLCIVITKNAEIFNLKSNIMSDEKTYIFPEGTGNSIDPNLWAALGNNGGGFGGGMWNNPIWAIVFLAFLRGGFGWGGNDGGCGNTAFVSSQLGQAVAGNANAISNLATNLNCSISQVQNAINSVQTSIQQVANANNMSAMQTINAINAGDAALANSLQSCCCNITNAVNTGFGNMRYESAAQTCSVKQSIADQTATVISKLDAIEDARKDREISNLTAALTAANSRAERATELAPIYKALSDIQCKQPKTETVYAPSVAAIPNCVAYQMGLYGGFPYGFNPSGSIWS